MINRLCRIADHLSNARTIKDAAQAVAAFACSSGQGSRLYLARIEGDFRISQLANVGFVREFSSLDTYGLKVARDLKMGHDSRQTLLFLAHNDAYHTQFFANHGASDDPKWKCTVLMEVNSNYITAVSMRVFISDEPEQLDYFNTIRSMLSLFLRMNAGPKASSKVATTSSGGKGIPSHLSERQEIILQMIESGATNQVIAEKLGYSESLIRQETITIYRKLGIAGRKDLNTGR